MRRARVLVSGALILSIAPPAVAQEFKPPTNLFGQKTPAPKPPKIDWNLWPSADRTFAANPTVVCGMTLVLADPTVDPKMRVAAPDSGVTFTMRVVLPTLCSARHEDPQR